MRSFALRPGDLVLTYKLGNAAVGLCRQDVTDLVGSGAMTMSSGTQWL